MTLPLLQSTQQVLETAYFVSNRTRRKEDGPIPAKDLYEAHEVYNHYIGDSLLTFLLNELVFDYMSELFTAEEYADSVRYRLEIIMREVTAVYLAVLNHLPDTTKDSTNAG